LGDGGKVEKYPALTGAVKETTTKQAIHLNIIHHSVDNLSLIFIVTLLSGVRKINRLYKKTVYVTL